MREIYYDELTGVYNRRFLYHWVDNEIKRANRFATKFGIIVIDLDNFRDINNNYGHLEGDRILIEFSNFLKNTVREVDNVVRYGGDEFVVLVPNTDARGLFELAQRILANLNQTEIGGHLIHCSIGCALYPDDGTHVEDLINQADKLMYQAKKEGKNRIGLKAEITKKIELPAKIVIGRERELDLIAQRWNDFPTIFLCGTAGVGKTRLALEVRNLFTSHLFLRANSYAALALVPYHPFCNMFRDFVNSDFILIQRVLKQLPAVHREELIKLLPEDTIVSIKSEGLDKYRLFESIKLFFIKLAEFIAPRVVLLLVDDLHWTDRTSCELLDFLIRSMPQNLHILGTYRIEEIKDAPINEFLGIWARENFYTKIDVPPLNEFQVEKLLEIIMGSVFRQLSEFIYRMSGGNPFYIEEILRELERQGHIFYNGKEWVLTVEKEIQVPTSIEATILRKIQFLDEETKSFLEVSAVFGQEFNYEIIALCLGKNVGETMDALDRLLRLGFIKERGDDTFFFSEDIVRQIIYKNIPQSDLVKYHRQVGEAMEKYFRGRIHGYYEQLAAHFIQARDSAKALFYSKQAAFKCKENYAHKAAVEFFETASKFEKNADELYKIKMNLAEIYYLMGENEKAIANLNACLKTNPRDYKIYHKLSQIYETMGDYRNALHYTNKGLKIATEPSAVYQFKGNIAWIYTRLGQYQKAKKECEYLLKKKKLIPGDELAVIYITLGVAFLYLGDLEKAIFYLNKGLQIRQKLGDKKGMAACYLDLAVVYQQQLNLSRSEEYYHHALKLYEEIGYQSGIVVTLLDLGSLYFHYSLLKAEDYLVKALNIAKLINAKRDMVFIYDNLGMIYLRRLMVDKAWENFQQALKYARETNFTEGYCFINVHLSEFYRETGRRKQGLGYLKRAYAYAKSLKLKQYIFDCQFEEMEYWLASSNLTRAKSLAKRLLADLAQNPDINRRVYGYIYNGRVLSASREFKRAQEYFDRALNITVKLPENAITAEIYYYMGLNFKRQNRYAEALDFFLKANEIFMKSGNLIYLDKIENEVAGVDISKAQ
ncbi:MAG: diguanylate cyclase [candidate division WOR-3 bacterium]